MDEADAAVHDIGMDPVYHRPIRFQLDERKATEAASLLLHRWGGERDFFSLVKVLYICEREHLRRFGRPICGDAYVSMKNGPVMSHVYNFIKNDIYDHSDHWSARIRKEGKHNVRLTTPFERAALSQAEAETLDSVFEKYGALGPWELEKLTHTFAEWKHPGKSCLPIEPEDILRAVGKTDAELESARIEAVTTAHLDSLFPAKRPK